MSYTLDFPTLNAAGMMYYTGGTHVFSHIGWGGSANPNSELIRFDMSSLPSPAEDIVIASASIWIKLIANTKPYNPLQVDAYLSSRDWVYNQVTRDVYKTGSYWQSLASTGANDYNHTLLGSVAMTATATLGWKEISLDGHLTDIDDLIKGNVTNNGFYLRPSADDVAGSGDDNAKEFDYAADKPYLRIEYDFIGGGSQPIFFGW